MHFLVVPSIREEHLKTFIDQWREEDHLLTINLDNLIVIEDNKEKTFNLDIQHHYSWKEIDEDLKGDSFMISRKDSAIRCYGFLVAYRLGATHIFTLDDDCYPIPGENFFTTHMSNVELASHWTETAGVRTRGIPYYNKGRLTNVVANMGLWDGVPDYDAVQTLSGQEKLTLPLTTRIMPHSQYMPVCGMNLMFKREVAVLSYFPLMDEYKRFDDIWFGIIFKKICDHLRLLISCGRPFVNHMRASDPFTNLIKESKGIQLNETFWQDVDAIPLTADTPIGCMIEVGNALMARDGYLRRLGEAIKVWVRYF